MKRDIKFNVYGSDELKDELKNFVDMYLTDTYISSLMDTVDSSEVTHVDVDLQDNILNITLYGSIDEEGSEEYASFIAEEIVRSAADGAFESGDITISILNENKNIIKENVEVPADIYDLCEYMYKESENKIDWIPEYEDIIDMYDMDISKEDYDKAYEIVKGLVDKIVIYNDLIQLSDNHTANEIDANIDEEEYWNQVQFALETLSEDIGTEVYAEGRMNRHICVDNTFENALKYDDFCKAQKEAEKDLIDFINTEYKSDELDEAKSDEISTYTIELNKGAVMRGNTPNETETIEGTEKDLMQFLDDNFVDCTLDDEDELVSLNYWLENYENEYDPSGSTVVLSILKDGKEIYKNADYDGYFNEYEEDFTESKEVKTESVESVDDITYLFEQFDWEFDITTKEQLGSDYYYHTLVKNVSEAEKFNYHSDYWGSADSYQKDVVDVVKSFEPYIGKEVTITYDEGEKEKFKVIGILIDKQYNSLSHLKVLVEPLGEVKEESKQVKTEDTVNPRMKDLANEVFDWYDSDMGNHFDEIKDNEKEFYNQIISVLENRDQDTIDIFIKDMSEDESMKVVVNQLKQLKDEKLDEAKRNLSAEDLFSEYQSISYDIYGLEWNSASSERRQELAKQAVSEFIQKFPQAKVKAREISDIMEDNNYHTDKKAFDELLKI